MKKPTKAKGKAKAVRRKRAKPKPAEKVTPVHLEKGLSIRMGLHDVIRAVKMIEKHGHLAKFAGKLKREGAQVRLPADTVNLVKDFVADNRMHKTSIGKHIVGGLGRTTHRTASRTMRAGTGATTSAPLSGDDGDPNKCNFGKAERG